MKQITEARLQHIKDHMLEIQKLELLNTRTNRIEKVAEWCSLLACIKDLVSLEQTFSFDELKAVIADIQGSNNPEDIPF